MITVVTGTDIEKLKGEFESVINGMNMVGEIPYNIYSQLFDVGTDCIQEAYELGKEKANEFHYCKDGLPEKEKSVLIYTEIKNVYMAKLVKDDYFITKEGGYVQTSAVIAWKEIILPKLPKENE